MHTRRSVVCSLAAIGGCATAPEFAPERAPVAVRPLVIAHRGASGERPEHTLGAYARAISQGADFIEPDLVMTRDGVLVCRHENEISATTDVASRSYFASRRSVKLIDGVSVEGWFTEDFTLDELKSLRCRERLPALRPANTAFDGQETIATFDEVCDLVAGEGIRLGRTIGVYPETKHPSYFESIGLSFDDPLIAALRRRRLDVAMAPCFIQSFETQNLKRLALSVRTPLVQLVGEAGGPVDAAHTGASYRAMVEDRGLEEIAGYAAGIGPAKGLILPRDPDGRSLAASDLVRRAHRFGLKVHAWTFRSENFFLPRELRRGDPAAPDHMRQKGDAAAELRAFFAMGVDGVFADFPAEAVAARA